MAVSGNLEVKDAKKPTIKKGGGKKKNTYTIQDGDSWTKIAEKLYGDQKVAAYLMAMNPDISVLHSGDTINLPGLPTMDDYNAAREARGAKGVGKPYSFPFGEDFYIPQGLLESSSMGYSYNQFVGGQYGQAQASAAAAAQQQQTQLPPMQGPPAPPGTAGNPITPPPMPSGGMPGMPPSTLPSDGLGMTPPAPPRTYNPWGEGPPPPPEEPVTGAAGLAYTGNTPPQPPNPFNLPQVGPPMPPANPLNLPQIGPPEATYDPNKLDPNMWKTPQGGGMQPLGSVPMNTPTEEGRDASMVGTDQWSPEALFRAQAQAQDMWMQQHLGISLPSGEIDTLALTQQYLRWGINMLNNISKLPERIMITPYLAGWHGDPVTWWVNHVLQGERPLVENPETGAMGYYLLTPQGWKFTTPQQLEAWGGTVPSSEAFGPYVQNPWQSEAQFEALKRSWDVERVLTNPDGTVNWDRLVGHFDPKQTNLAQAIIDATGFSGIAVSFAIHPERINQMVEIIDQGGSMGDVVFALEDPWAEFAFNMATDPQNLLGGIAPELVDTLTNVIFPLAPAISKAAEGIMSVFMKNTIAAKAELTRLALNQMRGSNWFMQITKESAVHMYTNAVDDALRNVALRIGDTPYAQLGAVGLWEHAFLQPESLIDELPLGAGQKAQVLDVINLFKEYELTSVSQILDKYGPYAGMTEDVIDKLLDSSLNDPEAIARTLSAAAGDLYAKELGVSATSKASLARFFNWAGRAAKENWLGMNPRYIMNNYLDNTVKTIVSGYVPAWKPNSFQRIVSYLANDYKLVLPTNVAQSLVSDVLDLQAGERLATASLPWPIGDGQGLSDFTKLITGRSLPDNIERWLTGDTLTAKIMGVANYTSGLKLGFNVSGGVERVARANIFIQAFEAEIDNVARPALLTEIGANPDMPPGLGTWVKQARVKNPSSFDEFIGTRLGRQPFIQKPKQWLSDLIPEDLKDLEIFQELMNKIDQIQVNADKMGLGIGGVQSEFARALQEAREGATKQLKQVIDAIYEGHMLPEEELYKLSSDPNLLPFIEPEPLTDAFARQFETAQPAATLPTPPAKTGQVAQDVMDGGTYVAATKPGSKAFDAAQDRGYRAGAVNIQSSAIAYGEYGDDALQGLGYTLESARQTNSVVEFVLDYDKRTILITNLVQPGDQTSMVARLFAQSGGDDLQGWMVMGFTGPGRTEQLGFVHEMVTGIPSGNRIYLGNGVFLNVPQTTGDDLFKFNLRQANKIDMSPGARNAIVFDGQTKRFAVGDVHNEALAQLFPQLDGDPYLTERMMMSKLDSEDIQEFVFDTPLIQDAKLIVGLPSQYVTGKQPMLALYSDVMSVPTLDSLKAFVDAGLSMDTPVVASSWAGGSSTYMGTIRELTEEAETAAWVANRAEDLVPVKVTVTNTAGQEKTFNQAIVYDTIVNEPRIKFVYDPESQLILIADFEGLHAEAMLGGWISEERAIYVTKTGMTDFSVSPMTQPTRDDVGRLMDTLKEMGVQTDAKVSWNNTKMTIDADAPPRVPEVLQNRDPLSEPILGFDEEMRMVFGGGMDAAQWNQRQITAADQALLQEGLDRVGVIVDPRRGLISVGPEHDIAAPRIGLNKGPGQFASAELVALSMDSDTHYILEVYTGSTARPISPEAADLLVKSGLDPNTPIAAFIDDDFQDLGVIGDYTTQLSQEASGPYQNLIPNNPAVPQNTTETATLYQGKKQTLYWGNSVHQGLGGYKAMVYSPKYGWLSGAADHSSLWAFMAETAGDESVLKWGTGFEAFWVGENNVTNEYGVGYLSIQLGDESAAAKALIANGFSPDTPTTASYRVGEFKGPEDRLTTLGEVASRPEVLARRDENQDAVMSIFDRIDELRAAGGAGSVGVNFDTQTHILSVDDGPAAPVYIYLDANDTPVVHVVNGQLDPNMAEALTWGGFNRSIEVETSSAGEPVYMGTLGDFDVQSQFVGPPGSGLSAMPSNSGELPKVEYNWDENKLKIYATSKGWSKVGRRIFVTRFINPGATGQPMLGLWIDGDLIFSTRVAFHDPMTIAMGYRSGEAATWVFNTKGQLVGGMPGYDEARAWVAEMIERGAPPEIPTRIVNVMGTGDPSWPFDSYIWDGSLGEFIDMDIPTREMHTSTVANLFDQGVKDSRQALVNQTTEDYSRIMQGLYEFEQGSQNFFNEYATTANTQMLARAQWQKQYDAVLSAKQSWLQHLEDASYKAVGEVNRILFDYSARGNIEEILRYYAPFTRWQMLNPLFWAQAFTKKPGILAAALHYQHATELERKRNALTERFKGTVQFNVGEGNQFMRPGTYGVNMNPAISAFSQAQQPFENPEWTPPDNKYTQFLRTIISGLSKIGMSQPWPWINYPLEKMGVQAPGSTSLSLGPQQRAIEMLMRSQGMLGPSEGLLGENSTSEWLMTYNTNRRIAEMEAEGLITHEQALFALRNPEDPVYKQAQQYVLETANTLGTVSLFSPFGVKFASPGEQIIRQQLQQRGQMSLKDREWFNKAFPYLQTYSALFGSDVDLEVDRILYTYQQKMEGLDPWSTEYRNLAAQRAAELEAIAGPQQPTEELMQLYFDNPIVLGEENAFGQVYTPEIAQNDVMFRLRDTEPRVGDFIAENGVIDWDAYQMAQDDFFDHISTISTGYGYAVTAEAYIKFRYANAAPSKIAYDLYRKKMEEGWELYTGMQRGGELFNGYLQTAVEEQYLRDLAAGFTPGEAAKLRAENLKRWSREGLPYEFTQKLLAPYAETQNLAQFARVVADMMGQELLDAKDYLPIYNDLQDDILPGMFGEPTPTEKYRTQFYEYYYNLTPGEQSLLKDQLGMDALSFPEDPTEAAKLWAQIVDETDRTNLMMDGILIANETHTKPYYPVYDQLTDEEKAKLEQARVDMYRYQKAAAQGLEGTWTPVLEEMFSNKESAQARFWSLLSGKSLLSRAFTDPMLGPILDRISRFYLDFTDEQYEAAYQYLTERWDEFYDPEATARMQANSAWYALALEQKDIFDKGRDEDMEILRAEYYSIYYKDRSAWEDAHPEEWALLEPYMERQKYLALALPYYSYLFRNYDYADYYGSSTPDTVDITHAQELSAEFLKAIDDLNAWLRDEGPWTERMTVFYGPEKLP